YRRDGLVYATGAGPAPYRQTQQAYRPSAAPVPPPVYAAPPARVRRGPGGTTVGITVGLVLLAGALLLGADRLYGTSWLPGSAHFLAAWLGIATVVLGVGI